MQNKYVFKLYIYGDTLESDRAVKNLKNIGDNELNGDYDLEIIDIKYLPEKAEEARLITIPTLIRETPLPIRRIAGDLSDREHVLFSLDISHKV